MSAFFDGSVKGRRIKSGGKCGYFVALAFILDYNNRDNNSDNNDNNYYDLIILIIIRIFIRTIKDTQQITITCKLVQNTKDVNITYKTYDT